MIKKISITLLVLLLLALAGGFAYFYYYGLGGVPTPTTTTVAQPPRVAPDNSVIAGPVTAVSATRISVKKQNGVVATLSIASTTQINLAGQNNQPVPKTLGDIKVGTMVLVTPSSADTTLAQYIVILSPPPAQ